MKLSNLTLLVGIQFFVVFAVHAGDELMKDFDSLGGNDVLLEKAQSLTPSTKIGIVQKRVVNRLKRFELSFEGGTISSNDSYVVSRKVGLSTQFHINPHWSVGAKYNYFFNNLTPEGKKIYDEAERDVQSGNSEGAIVPAVNWQKSSISAVINWYPIYGKLNIFDKGIVQFDMYGILGAGKTQLRYNSAQSYQAGIGFGFWLSQHLTSRIELTKETFSASALDGSKQNFSSDETSLSVGYLF